MKSKKQRGIYFQGLINDHFETTNYLNYAVYVTDLRGDIQWMNVLAEKQVGASLMEVSGTSIQRYETAYDAILKLVSEKNKWEGPTYHRHHDGYFISQWSYVFKLYDCHKAHCGYGVVGLTQLAGLLHSKENLLFSNGTGFTNVSNRHQLIEDLSVRVAAKKSEQLTLILIDIDDFADINHYYGFKSGDLVLSKTIERIQHVIHTKDILYRYASDIFAVLIHGTKEREKIESFLVYLQQVLKAPVAIGERKVSLSVSMGVHINQNHILSAEQFLHGAEIALQETKKEDDKQFVHFYTKDLDEKITLQLRLEKELEAAIGANEFSIHYQPIVDNITYKIVGAETLLRWNHPELGMISPIHFIPYAEKSGLIDPLGYLIIEQVFTDIHKQSDPSLDDLMYTINLSVKQLSNEQLVPKLMVLLERYKVNPKRIIFEITESARLNHSATVLRIFNQLRILGFRLALDDFGKGFSSLSLLAHFKVDFIKIDKDFITNVYTDKNSKGLTEAIFSMAKQIGLGVVAEGVESVDDARFLSNQPSDYLQGYLFSKPIERNMFVDLVRDINMDFKKN